MMDASQQGGRLAEIRSVAVQLFYERGYNGTSIKDIAAVLNIQPPSLYSHIRSKQELLRQIIFEGIDLLQQEFDAAVASTSDTTEQLRRAAEVHVRHHARRQLHAHVSTYEIPSLEEPHRSQLLERRRAYARAWQGLIERGNRDGACNAANPKIAAFAVLDLGIGVARWYRPDGELTESHLARLYGEMTLSLLRALPEHIDRAPESWPGEGGDVAGGRAATGGLPALADPSPTA